MMSGFTPLSLEIAPFFLTIYYDKFRMYLNICYDIFLEIVSCYRKIRAYVIYGKKVRLNSYMKTGVYIFGCIINDFKIWKKKNPENKLQFFGPVAYYMGKNRQSRSEQFR